VVAYSSMVVIAAMTAVTLTWRGVGRASYNWLKQALYNLAAWKWAILQACLSNPSTVIVTGGVCQRSQPGVGREDHSRRRAYFARRRRHLGRRWAQAAINNGTDYQNVNSITPKLYFRRPGGWWQQNKRVKTPINNRWFDVKLSRCWREPACEMTSVTRREEFDGGNWCGLTNMMVTQSMERNGDITC